MTNHEGYYVRHTRRHLLASPFAKGYFFNFLLVIIAYAIIHPQVSAAIHQISWDTNGALSVRGLYFWLTVILIFSYIITATFVSMILWLFSSNEYEEIVISSAAPIERHIVYMESPAQHSPYPFRPLPSRRVTYESLAPDAPNWADLPPLPPDKGLVDRRLAQQRRQVGNMDEMYHIEQKSRGVRVGAPTIREAPAPIRTTPGTEQQYDAPPALPPPQPRAMPNPSNPYNADVNPRITRENHQSYRDAQIRRIQAEQDADAED